MSPGASDLSNDFDNPSSFLFLVRPGAPSSVLAPSSNALVTSSEALVTSSEVFLLHGRFGSNQDPMSFLPNTLQSCRTSETVEKFSFLPEDRLMLHSYGDSELVCGLDSTGTTGAWRSPRGMLAITKPLGRLCVI